MKIAPELLTLSREHHISLSLANKCINTDKTNDKEQIRALCLAISNHFERSFKSHFDTEEFTILMPLKDKSVALRHLCERLEKEHQQLYQMAKTLATNMDLLKEFGSLLKTHTRVEDRELFVHIQLLSQDQRLAIEKMSEQHATPIKRFF